MATTKILSLLRDTCLLIKWNKFDTHCDTSIRSLKLMSTITTLYSTARFKVETVLLNVSLTPDELLQFIAPSEGRNADDETTKHDNSDKKSIHNSGKTKSTNNIIIDVYSQLELLAFDLSSISINYGNGKKRVKNIAFKITCHPKDATIL